MDNARCLLKGDNTDFSNKDVEDTENVDIFPFICGLCFEKFRWITQYLDHFHLHNQEGIAKQLLGVKIINKADLQRVEFPCTNRTHIREDSELPPTTSCQNKASQLESNSACSFHCSSCKRRFPGVCQFNEHFTLPRLKDEACKNSGKENETLSVDGSEASVTAYEDSLVRPFRTVTNDKQKPMSDCKEANEGFSSEINVEDSIEKYQHPDVPVKRKKHDDFPFDKQLNVRPRKDTKDVSWKHEDVVTDCVEGTIGSGETRGISVKHIPIGITRPKKNTFKPSNIDEEECNSVSYEEFKDDHSIDKTECKQVHTRENAHKTIESADIDNDVADDVNFHSEDHIISNNAEDTVNGRGPNYRETIEVNNSADLYDKSVAFTESNDNTQYTDPKAKSDQMEDRCLKDEKIPCDVCGVLSLKKNLRRHVLSHNKTKPYQCDMCNKSFKTKDQLYGHKLHHKTKKDLICDHCGKAFNNGPNLRQHMKIHTRGRTLTCPVCSKTFRSNYILKDHISRHSDNKPYMCEVCGKAFRTGNEVHRHLRVHSENRPHSCWRCEKSFKSRSNLIKHAKTHTREAKTHT